VVEFALERALKGLEPGVVDPETQFALLWRWTYGNNAVEVGAAMLLDKATGVELGELERAGMLARTDGSKKMLFLGPEQRPDLLDTGLQRAMAGIAPLVDVAYTAALLWKENRREELAELLATQGDAARRVAQALAELQPSDTSERKLLLGVLGSWSTHQSSTRAANPGRLKQGTLDI